MDRLRSGRRGGMATPESVREPTNFEEKGTKTVPARPPQPTPRGRRVLPGIARLAPSREIRRASTEKGPAEYQNRLVRLDSVPLTQIKAGFGIWLDLARVEVVVRAICAAIAEEEGDAARRAAARPVTSASAKMGRLPVRERDSAFAPTRTRHFSRMRALGRIQNV